MNRPPFPPGPGGGFASPVRRPGGTGISQFEEMQRRVQASYGSFGVRPDGAQEEADPLADSFRPQAIKIILGLLAGSIVGAVLGNLSIGLAVVWLPLLYRAMVKRPVHMSARVLFTLALFLESPSDMPGGTYWTQYGWLRGDLPQWPGSPLDAANLALFGSIKDLTGMPGMSLPLFFFLALWLLYRARKENRRAKIEPPPRFARRVLLVFLGAVLALETLGMLRGGNLDPSFRQILHLTTMPLVALALLHAFRGKEDLAAMGTIIVVVAVARTAIVAFVYFVVCGMHGVVPEYATTHSDTVLFVVAILVLFSWTIEKRNAKSALRCALLALVVFAGIVMNNRRLAFVSLGVAPAAMYVVLKASPGKRRISRILLIAIPLLAVYIGVGSQIPTMPIFAPARLAVSVLDQSDASSESRDIENGNLILTLSHNPVVGRGFGFEYEEKIKLYDISDLFKYYRYIAHNGVLWIWSVGGVVGFTFLWFIYPVAGTLAIRAYRGGATPIQRAAGLTALGTTVVCVAQIWGDQGFNSYLTLTLFSAAFAVAARQAMMLDEAEDPAGPAVQTLGLTGY